MTRVAFATLGCRVNQVDTGELQARLAALGCRTVPFGSAAEVVVINTCTVTSRADVSDRQLIRRAIRGHPNARIVVTGCWARTDPEAAAAIPGVDLVVGSGEQDQRLDALVRMLGAAGADRDVPAIPPAAALPQRSRAFAKIQDGCQHRCAFCIVPRARGPSRSRDPELVVDQVRALVAAGHPEVVLTGIDMGHYGWDLRPRTTLAALLSRLAGIPGLRWLRLSSVLPAYFTPELIEAVTALPPMVPHVHIPLQSGSDPVLRRMRRPYTASMYRRLIETLAGRIPDLGLGTDLIAGFPGETAADVERTVALVDALPFSYLHVFAYSDRAGTEAASLAGHVPAGDVTARSRRLRALGEAKSLAFRSRLVGTVRDALVLGARDRASGRLRGITDNYVELTFDGPDLLQGRLVRVRVTAAHPRGTDGDLVP